MATWFTSDLHLGHANIIRYTHRPYADVDEMNRALVDRWNDRVGDGDLVWVLGDMCLGRLADSLPLVGLLRGEKWLVPGNHDRVHPMHASSGAAHRRWADAYDDVFDRVLPAHPEDLPRIDVGGHEVLLAHFPYGSEPDHRGRDLDAWRQPDDGVTPLLCGHVHQAWRRRGRMVNVGVDVWSYAPAHEDEVAAEVAAAVADPAGAAANGGPAIGPAPAPAGPAAAPPGPAAR